MSLTKETLINFFLNSSTAQKKFKIGIELEMFLCKKETLNPITKPELIELIKHFPDNWERIYSNNNIKGLKNKNCNISFEPGLQLEFSSLPEDNLNLLENSYNLFMNDLNKALSYCNSTQFAIGYHPFLNKTNTPFLGGKRYEFMYNYMEKVGTLGRNMMKNTTTLQTNIDYHNSEDLQKKIQVLANITPFLIYFSASSPFKENKITSFLSYRNHIWDNTDKNRCGIPDFYFKKQFTIEKYIDYLINIPVYFLIRDNKYIINTKSYTFLDLMNHKSKEIHLTVEDFILHLSTVFPDIRLKNYLEIRSCDTMGTNIPLAIPALIVGLLYNSNNLEYIFDITQNWSKEHFLILKNHLNTKGLTNDTVCGVNLINFATQLINLAHNGLKLRKLNEEYFLEPLNQILISKTNLAQKYIELFHKNNNIKDIIIKHIINNSFS